MISRFILTALLSVSVVAQAAADKKAAPAAPKAIEMKIDAAASKIEWAGTKKIGSGHTGLIAVKEGAVKMEGSKLTGGEIVIDMSKIAVTDIPATEKDNAKLVGHLSSEDFFDAKKFSTAKLAIKSSKEIAPGKLEVTADLTIKDVTKPITFPVEVKTDKGMTTAMGKLSVNRTEFGIKYGSGNFFKLAADRVINDNFDLTFNLTAKN